MTLDELEPGRVIAGPILPEPTLVLEVTFLSERIKATGAGTRTGQVHQRLLHLDPLAALCSGPEPCACDGEPGVGRDERFWRLAQVLAAFYPMGIDEKCGVDGMPARKNGLGF